MSMKINTIGYSAVGKRHLSVGQENQDCFQFYEDDRIIAAALSDGASGAEEAARPAAEATAAACIEFAKNVKIWNMKKKQLSEELLRMCDDHYYELLRKLVNEEDNQPKITYDILCATMVLLIVNKISGQYIAILIGDCSLMLIDRKLKPSILLSPVNIITKRITKFANDPVASRYIKIERGSLENTDITGFILNTDGAEDLLNDSRNDDIRRISALTVMNREAAKTALQRCVSELSECNPDDITAAFVMLDNDDMRRIAAAELGNDYDGYITGEDSGIHAPEKEETAGTGEYGKGSEQQKAADNDIWEFQKAEPDGATLPGFLATPRTAEELLLAGFVSRETDLLTVLYPYLRDKLVVYKNYRFSAMKG